jgi:hypothetical protein
MADFNTEQLNLILAQCIDNQPKAQKKLFDILAPKNVCNMLTLCAKQ